MNFSLLLDLPAGPSDAVRAFLGARGCCAVRESGRGGKEWVGWVVRGRGGGGGEHEVIEVDLGMGWGVVCSVEVPYEKPSSLEWPVAWKAVGLHDVVMMRVASRILCLVGVEYYSDFVITNAYDDAPFEVGIFPIAQRYMGRMRFGWPVPEGWQAYHTPPDVKRKVDWLAKWMGGLQA
jgi:hypothetical protein